MRTTTVFMIASFGVLGCSGKESVTGPQEPSALALSVHTSPNPVTFALLPPRVPPGDPLPPCCQTLSAHWSIELRASAAEGQLESVSGVLRSGSQVYGEVALDRPLQGPVRLVPGGSVVLSQSLLARMPESVPDAFYARIQLGIRLDNGSRLQRELDIPLIRS